MEEVCLEYDSFAFNIAECYRCKEVKVMNYNREEGLSCCQTV
jgi:hypothetical protein